MTDVYQKVRINPTIYCQPVLCLLEDEIITKRDAQGADLGLVRQLIAEGETVVAIVFQIMEDDTAKTDVKPLREYLQDVPKELRWVSLLTTHWNHIRAIAVHKEMDYQDLKEMCEHYSYSIPEVSFNNEFTKGWLMSTITAVELTPERKAG